MDCGVSTPVMSSFLPSSSIGSPLWPRLARPHRALPMLPTRPGMRLSFPGRRLSCAPRTSPPLAEPFDGAGGQLPMRSLSRLPLATIVAAILVLGIAPPAQALPACTDQGLAFYPLATPLRYLDTAQGYTAWWPQTYPLSTQRFQGRVNGIPSGARALVARVTLSNYRGEWPECHWYENAYFEGYFCDYEGEPSTSARYPRLRVSTAFTNSTTGAGVLRAGSGPSLPTEQLVTFPLATDGTFVLSADSVFDTRVEIVGYYAPPGPGGLCLHMLSRPSYLFSAFGYTPVGPNTLGRSMQAGESQI